LKGPKFELYKSYLTAIKETQMLYLRAINFRDFPVILKTADLRKSNPRERRYFWRKEVRCESWFL